MKMHPSSVVVDSYQDVVHGQEDNAFISFFFLLSFIWHWLHKIVLL